MSGLLMLQDFYGHSKSHRESIFSKGWSVTSLMQQTSKPRFHGVFLRAQSTHTHKHRQTCYIFCILGKKNPPHVFMVVLKRRRHAVTIQQSSGQGCSDMKGNGLITLWKIWKTKADTAQSSPATRAQHLTNTIWTCIRLWSQNGHKEFVYQVKFIMWISIKDGICQNQINVYIKKWLDE